MAIGDATVYIRPNTEEFQATMLKLVGSAEKLTEAVERVVSSIEKLAEAAEILSKTEVMVKTNVSSNSETCEESKS